MKMAVSIFQRLCKKRLGLSTVCHIVSRRLLVPSNRRFLVQPLEIDSRCTFANVNKYGRQSQIPLMGVRWQITLSSGPWSLGGEKKPPKVKKDKEGSHPHTNVWAAERLTGVVMLALLPLDFIFPSAILESICAVCAVFHGYWGFENVVADYLRPIIVGRIINKISYIILTVTSIIVFIGLMKLIIYGPGVAEVIKSFWIITGD